MSAEKRWVLKPQGDAAKVAALAAALDIPPVLANLLVQRGIETEEEAWQFFNPKLENLHDPFLMKDMDRAVERIDEAVKRNEPIMVYGDYDVDGTTAVALVYSFLRRLGLSSLLFYIPIEIIITAVELLCYRRLLTEKGRGRAVGYAVAANVCSATVGLLLIDPLWRFIVSIS